MKKLLFLICILASSYAANAQFVLTPSGLVDAKDSINSYVVINMEGKTQAEIYDIVSLRLNRMYNHPNITQSKIEPKSIQISGVADEVIYVCNRLGRAVYGDLKHTINIEFRDGRMKVDVISFEITDSSGNDVPLVMPNHSWIYTINAIYSKKGQLKMERTKQEVETYFNSFVQILTKDTDLENEW